MSDGVVSVEAVLWAPPHRSFGASAGVGFVWAGRMGCAVLWELVPAAPPPAGGSGSATADEGLTSWRAVVRRADVLDGGVGISLTLECTAAVAAGLPAERPVPVRVFRDPPRRAPER